MHLPRPLLIALILAIALVSLPALAQTVLTTVNVDSGPYTAGVNVNSNQVYVANECGTDSSCQTPVGTISVIDGSTFTVQSIPTGDFYPYGVGVNPLTNQIYVASCGSTDGSCFSPGTVVVIDGATLTTQEAPVGIYTGLVAVNPVTNMVYVVNQCGNDTNCASPGTVTVVNGTDLTTQTVTVGFYPYSVAVNSATNQIYVSSACTAIDDTGSCTTPGTVTQIDGASLATQTANTGWHPALVRVNSVTNQVYVTNNCGSTADCTDGTITVIDGNSLATQSVTVGLAPFALAVNAKTNTIYVGNDCGDDPNCASASTVSVIDGATLLGTEVSVCDSQSYPAEDMEVNPVTNQLFLACNGGTGNLTIVDGATNNVITLPVGTFPNAAVVDALTNRVFVPNVGDDTVTVASGPNAQPLQFASVVPCRLVDTRNPHNPIPGGTSRDFVVPSLGDCGIPSNAAAYSLNVTVVPPAPPLGYLTIWPTGEDQPYVSTLNSYDGRTKANAAIVPAGYQGAVSVYVTNTTDLILDIDGYFAPASDQTSQFYPLTPCRVIDTRGDVGDLGGPFLSAGVERDFPVLESSCLNGVTDPQAYSMNFTVVPHPGGQPLGYLTVWPQGQDQPTVSTLNNPTATVVANAAIVPAGDGGGIATFAFNDTDLIVDINGYFAAPGSGGLSLYPAAPCRAFDSRLGAGNPFQGELTIDVVDSPCAPPSEAQGYVFNATVVPPGFLDFLTLWPDGEDQPVVSTLNAYDGFVGSNMAIVPNLNGLLDAFASQLTHLIMDISGYFAPVMDGGTRHSSRSFHPATSSGPKMSGQHSGRMPPHGLQCRQSVRQRSFAPFGCSRSGSNR